MQNLELVSLSLEKVPAIFNSVRCFDFINGDFFFLVDSKLYKFPPLGEITREGIGYGPLLNTLQYLPEHRQLFLADPHHFIFQNGEGEGLQIRCGDGELLACSYCPKRQKLAYVVDAKNQGAPNQKLYLADIGLDDLTISVQFMAELDAPPPVPVNVEWGSVATQFFGFDNSTAVDELRQAAPEICQDTSISIVWRPDAEYFLVAYYDAPSCSRRFKVYHTTNRLISQSEHIPGLMAPIAWRTARDNAIVVACTSSNKRRLVVFEPNGLAKLGVNLEEPGEILQLEWSPNGEVLAVLQARRTEWHISLLTVYGFRFEVKKKLSFEKDILGCKWILRDGILAVLTVGSCIQYRFRPAVTVSATRIDGGTTVAVIEGPRVRMVNLDLTRIPPPFSALPAYETTMLTFEHSINFVIFSQSRQSFVCIDCWYTYYYYDYFLEENGLTIRFQNSFSLPGDRYFPLNIHHFALVEDYLVMYVTETVEDCESLVKFDMVTKTVVSAEYFEDKILAGINIIHKPDCIDEYRYFNNGLLYLNGTLVTNIPEGIKKVDDIAYGNQNFVVILSEKGNLVVNYKFIDKNVSNFILFDKYLLYVSGDQIRNTRLDVLQRVLQRHHHAAKYFDTRTLVNGGSLIVALPEKKRALFQTPLGAIESIYTTLLGIDYLNDFLANDQWDEALKICRKHQLNPNILIDTDYDRFIANAATVISLLNNGSLQEFIMAISSENVITASRSVHQFRKLPQVEDKIEKVCSTLISEMEKSITTYIEPIVVAKYKGFDLDCAVSFLQGLFAAKDYDNMLVERGLKTLCFYLDDGEISMSCFRTYDLKFVKFAHTVNNYDPQITSMLIKDFTKSASEYERKYKINKYTGRHNLAVEYYTMHLLKENEDNNDETHAFLLPVLEYAESVSEMPSLYTFLKQNNVIVDEVWRRYADILEFDDKYVEAAKVYIELKEYQLAYNLYVSRLMWKEALVALHLMNLPQEEENDRLVQLGQHLEALSKFEGAAEVYLKLKSNDRAILALVRVPNFTRALALAKATHPELLDSIRTALIQCSKSLQEYIRDVVIETFEYASRVQCIWKERLDRGSRPIEHGEDGGEASYAESLRSSATGRSTSSKRSRKERRKYVALKAGSPYEDIAIMRAVSLRIIEMKARRDEMLDYRECLKEFDEFEKLEELESCWDKMMSDLCYATDMIWIENLNDLTKDSEALRAARKNFDCIEREFLVSPSMEDLEFPELASKGPSP